MSLREVLAVSGFSPFTHANEILHNTTPLFFAFANGYDAHVRALVEQHGAVLNLCLGDPNMIHSVYAIEQAKSIDIVRYAMAHDACRESIQRLLDYSVQFASIRRILIVVHLLDNGYKTSASRALWVDRFIAFRNAAKRTIATVIGLRTKCAVLRALGKDVVQLVACAMWEMREEFVDE